MATHAPRLSSRFAVCGAVLLAAALALAFRLPELGRRPMHCDEAVHAVKMGDLLESGTYAYDPADFHGPTIYYAALPFAWFGGAKALPETSEFTFRIMPVLFGVGLVLLLLAAADGLGAWAAGLAAALTAVSPAMVYYSRYYIQEIPLIFFSFAAILTGWRYTRKKTWFWALVAGVFLGLMHATKETCVLAWAAMAGACVLTAMWACVRNGRIGDCPKRTAAEGSSETGRSLNFHLIFHLLGALIAGVGVSALFMSAFFTRPRGILDSWLTYADYLSRADGASLHDHPWYYYFRMLLYYKNAPGPWWSEAFILVLAALGIVYALAERRRPRQKESGDLASDARANGRTRGDPGFRRFLAFYTLLLTVIYAVIPYKTPWCMLGSLHGMILLAGIGAVAIMRRLPNRWARAVIGALLLAGMLHLARQSYRTAFAYAADTRNPYAYAHSSTDVVRLASRVEDIARHHGDGPRMLVKIIAEEYWPLPWYLRRMARVGYWEQVPDEPDAPVLIVSPALQPEVDAKIGDQYHRSYYGLRPEVLLVLYVEEDLWDAFLETRE